MFVPTWPDGHNGVTINEANNIHHTNNQTANQSDDTIEMNKSEATAAISNCENDVGQSVNAGEDDGDAMDQCAMWNANFPDDKPEEPSEYNINSVNENSNIVSSFGGGDIWSSDAFSFESPLKDLLDTNNFSLVELLAQDELLQELRACEARLVDYFSRPEVVAGLVECVVCEIPYSREKRGKERWCEEEAERQSRRLTKSDKHGSLDGYDENGNDYFWPKRRAPTVLATTDETDDEPHIEASWNSPMKNPVSLTSEYDVSMEDQRSPEEEYDLRYVRYPYMACEVLCSGVGSTLDILVDGYVEDIIDDDEDSLLNDDNGKLVVQETKRKEENNIYDKSTLRMDERGTTSHVSPDIMLEGGQHLEAPQQLGSTPTQHRTQTPQRRILDLLFSLLIDTPPSSLDDRRAGYFEKILVVLFQRRPQAMSDYMNTSLIVTLKSTEMAQDLFCRNSLDLNGIVDPYVSGFGCENEDNASHFLSHQTSNSKITQLLASNFASPKAPPMLMCALFDHLHSHSIMHIIQRLLLPSTGRQNNSKEAVDQSNHDSPDLESDNPNSAMNEQFMNTISQINSTENRNLNPSDEDDELGDDGVDNAMDHIFQCDWSDQPGQALELLLWRLEGRTEPFLLKYTFPVGYQSKSKEDFVVTSSEGEPHEAKLSCSQHASEILISIIQNSPLDSPVMSSLSSDPVLSRILRLTRLSTDESVYVPHDSTMTCAMTVLESLILQLGGYGAVSTAAEPGGDRKIPSPYSPPVVNEIDKSFSLTELGPHTPTTSPSAPDVAQSKASTATLVQHLPVLLEDLSLLLTHPATKSWASPAQYTRFEARPILGTARLRILRLVESIVLLADPLADLLLQQSDCLECCLDLFWEFEWCSMLQQSVANFLVHVFEGGDERAGLQDYFIVRCQLLEKLMDSFNQGSRSYVFGPDVGECISEKLGAKVGYETKVESSPEFGDMVKALYKSSNVSSSMESLHGSESDSSHDGRLSESDDTSAVAPVSEDDVDSAMEKEEQENETMIEVSDSPMHSCHADNESSDHDGFSESPAAPLRSAVASFRRGYLGHVIIISQAIVNACNARNQINNLRGDRKPEDESKTIAEWSPGNARNENGPVNPKKRKDRSPTRIYGEHGLKRIPSSKESDGVDLFSPISPIPKSPCSPNEMESQELSSNEYQLDEDTRVLSHIGRTLCQHPLFSIWQTFVSSTLASEMTAQSTPLGGQSLSKGSGGSVASDPANRMVTIIDDDSDHEFLGGDPVGEIDMDENDLDIAAQMMESLSIPPTTAGDIGPDDGAHNATGHNRCNRVIGGDLLLGSDANRSVPESSSTIGNFGSVIKRHDSMGSQEYIYDDPLGNMRPFDTDEESDERILDSMFDSIITYNGRVGTEDSSGSTGKDGSNADEDDDDIPPVMDLFAGNFSSLGDKVGHEISENNGWANFDDAFALEDVP